MASSSYLDYFGLKDDPFRLSPDPDYYYPSAEHTNALLSLDFTLTNREGFCLLTGEPGTGKTTLLRIFLSKWQGQAEIALVLTPRLTPEEFLQAILEDLDVIYPLSGNKNDMIKEFRDFLLEHAGSGRPVLIIVDEAQELPDETMEELRLLSNLETEKNKLLQIILVGQPELSQRLATDKLRQLDQRITVRATLSPLPPRAMDDYLASRLIKAGAHGSIIFDDQAKQLLFTLSKGIPRLINLIASRALMASYLQNVHTVHGRQVELAAQEVMRSEARQSKQRSAAVLAWGLIGGAIAILIAVFLLHYYGLIRL